MRSSYSLHPVDSNSPIPFYLQVLEELDGVLKSGVWEPGDMMPTEAQLCDEFNVSRIVVRRALKELEHRGQIERIRGKGTFVTGQSPNSKQDSTERPISMVSKILRFEGERPSEIVAQHLEIDTNSTVFALEKVEYLDKRPHIYSKSYIPESVCYALRNADLTRDSLYSYLENTCDIVVAHGSRAVEVALADEELAQILDCQVGDPLLMLRGTTYTDTQFPIEYHVSYHHGDHTQLHIRLVARDDT